MSMTIFQRLIFLRPIRYGGPALAAAFFYSSKPNNQTGWTLRCGAYCAPKGPLDAKREARLECCGEDSFAVVENQFQSVVAVADGVGGWRAKGVDPSKFSRSLMRHLEAIITGTSGWFRRGESPLAFISPTTLIRQAFWRLVGGYHSGKEQPFGSSTICVACLDRSSGTLETANLGDSGFLLLRGREVILQSRAQQHRFNAPYQLTLAPDGNVSDCSHMSAPHGCAVETGDILILATDGLWDNLFEEDVTRLVAMGGEPMEMAKRLALEARRMSEKDDYQSPFSVEATRNGLNRLGGKEDDITVVVAVPQYIGEASVEK
ncbi:hypothetical protein PSACC_02271 [Paramicrosporidium saccamoebae]|uniref:Protein phosphatase n=1 Tax=Paramicrosporidium saccamoebae TaxID=1246581 RepID=A0A2H9TJN0_9FUNG|nr:hypothetical protein PSACC_02271 [Paramicrosporidium saccamoebae]